MPFQRVNEIVSAKIGNALTNIQSWGGVIYNVKAFGAVGDGVTDDTAAIQAAINAAKDDGGGIVFFPKGKYRVTSTLVIDDNISLWGAGSDATKMDIDPALTNSVSAIVWDGPAGGTVIDVSGRVGGVHWQDFVVDCANIAAYGVDVDRLWRSVWSNIQIIRATTNCLKLVPRGTGPEKSDNIMFNTFINVALLRCPVPLLLDGNDFGNVCHNNFINLSLDYTGNGMDLYNCDNNNFSMVFTFRRSGTGFGAVFNNRCRANYFYQMQGTIWAKSGSKNIVFGYDRENGQARPTVDPGAELFWTENGNNAAGWHMTTALENLMARVLASSGTPASNLNPDPTLFKMAAASNGQWAGWQLFDGGPGMRRLRLWLSMDGSGPYLPFEISNRGLNHLNMNNQKGGSVSIIHADRPPLSAGEFLPTGKTSWIVGDKIFNNSPAPGGFIGWVCVEAGDPGTWKGFGTIQS